MTLFKLLYSIKTYLGFVGVSGTGTLGGLSLTVAWCGGIGVVLTRHLWGCSIALSRWLRNCRVSSIGRCAGLLKAKFLTLGNQINSSALILQNLYILPALFYYMITNFLSSNNPGWDNTSNTAQLIFTTEPNISMNNNKTCIYIFQI